MIPTNHPDDNIETVATGLAEQIIAEMDQRGIVLNAHNNRALLAHLAQTLLRVSRQREKDARDYFATWIHAANLLSAEVTATRLGISYKALKRACVLGMIQPATPPREIQQHAALVGTNAFSWFPVTTSLTTEQRVRLAQRNLLTRVQAAQRLQIPVAVFDRLREEHHLQGIDTFPTAFGDEGDLYRSEDIDQLLP